MLRLLLAVVLATSLLTTPALAACDDGHWISEVVNDGAVVVLQDGSMWRVDGIDQIDTALWLPLTSIAVCDGNMLINTDDGEKAHVRPIR